MITARFLPVKTGESIMTSMKQGFAFIRRQGAMEVLIVLAFCMTFLAVPARTFLPVYARDIFHHTIGTGENTVVDTLKNVRDFGAAKRKIDLESIIDVPRTIRLYANNIAVNLKQRDNFTQLFVGISSVAHYFLQIHLLAIARILPYPI
jgi:hypothetical protein